MDWIKILEGLAVGCVLGYFNALLLSALVRKTIVPGGGGKSKLTLLVGFLGRYLVLAVIVIWLFRIKEFSAAIALLLGVAVMTQVVSILRRKKGNKANG